MKNKPSAVARVEKLKTIRKGSFTAISWKTETKPAAAYKQHKLEKLVSAVVRVGIAYANLASVKAGIASGERGEVESLPWGEWLDFPYTIAHKGETYLRVYPSKKNRQRITYLIDGNKVSKTEFSAMLTPSQQVSKSTDCMTLKTSNLVG